MNWRVWHTYHTITCKVILSIYREEFLLIYGLGSIHNSIWHTKLHKASIIRGFSILWTGEYEMCFTISVKFSTRLDTFISGKQRGKFTYAEMWEWTRCPTVFISDIKLCFYWYQASCQISAFLPDIVLYYVWSDAGYPVSGRMISWMSDLQPSYKARYQVNLIWYPAPSNL